MHNRLVWLFVVAAAYVPVSAGVIGISTRAELGANDYVDWGQLGAPLVVFGTPLTVTSDGGTEVSIKSDAGVFSDRQDSSYWNGNFAPGDALIGTGQLIPSSSIYLTFARPVRGVATQIGYNIVTGTPFEFTASMTLYSTTGQEMATIEIPAWMDNRADNSATVLGALATDYEIARVRFAASAPPAAGAVDGSFAINRVDFLATPEPGTLGLLGIGLGLAALGGMRRTRRR
jgi:hypothetical protein